MRQIKFRAWNKVKKVMCYDNEDGNADYWGGVLASNVGLINYYLKSPDSEYSYMQFTGLMDKNGTEIYEGDVVRDDNDDLYVVKWHERIAVFFFDGHFSSPIDGLEDAEVIEVIGNIYENPELLEAK